MIMTEDDNGRVRAGDERELLNLEVVEFFMKLQVFKERMDERIANSKKSK